MFSRHLPFTSKKKTMNMIANEIVLVLSNCKLSIIGLAITVLNACQNYSFPSYPCEKRCANYFH